MTQTGDTGQRPRGVTGMVPGPKAAKVRRSALSRVLYSLFVMTAVVALLSMGLLAYGYSIYGADGPLQASKVFQIKRGQQTPDIAVGLQQAGIISDASIFTAAVVISGKKNSMQAGEYEFPAHGSMREVANIIASGKAILYKVSIPEGFTTEQGLNRIRQNEVLEGNLTLSPNEGELMPDTYVFRRSKTRDEIVQDMIDAQVALKAELWASRKPDTVAKTPEEAVILASIVEKETAVADERPRVAAVFANRLKLGMRLQSDPTIIYGITLGKTKLDRALTRADIAEATPYNTYRFKGLPPGPIANPGRAALHAVLNPIVSKDIYFVADGSGGHAFAETLEQHNTNVAKWRKIEQAADDPVQEAAAVPAPIPEAGAEPVAPSPTSTAPDVPGKIEPPADEAAAVPVPGAPAATAEPIPEEVPAAAPAAKPTNSEKVADTPAPKPVKEANAVVIPVPKPAMEEIALDTPPADVPPVEPKPGSVIKVANRLVPIPVPKPKGP